MVGLASIDVAEQASQLGGNTVTTCLLISIRW
jgi:hypothetical protein